MIKVLILLKTSHSFSLAKGHDVITKQSFKLKSKSGSNNENDNDDIESNDDGDLFTVSYDTYTKRVDDISSHRGDIAVSLLPSSNLLPKTIAIYDFGPLIIWFTYMQSMRHGWSNAHKYSLTSLSLERQ